MIIFRLDFQISDRISRFQSAFLDSEVGFCISEWVSGFQSGFLEFNLNFADSVRDFFHDRLLSTAFTLTMFFSLDILSAQALTVCSVFVNLHLRTTYDRYYVINPPFNFLVWGSLRLTLITVRQCMGIFLKHSTSSPTFTGISWVCELEYRL